MSHNSSLVCVVTTVANAEDAKRLSKMIVQSALAGCVQVDGPITSHYRWAGELQESQEFRLTMKTTEAAWPRLQSKIEKDHPYDEPELIMFRIDAASKGYAAWVSEQTDP